MIVKILAAILAVAILDCASQTVRCSRYLDAQDQTELATGRTEIALSDIEVYSGIHTQYPNSTKLSRQFSGFDYPCNHTQTTKGLQ